MHPSRACDTDLSALRDRWHKLSLGWMTANGAHGLSFSQSALSAALDEIEDEAPGSPGDHDNETVRTENNEAAALSEALPPPPPPVQSFPRTQEGTVLL